MSFTLSLFLVALFAALAAASPVGLAPTSRLGSFHERKKKCWNQGPLTCYVSPTKGYHVSGVIKFFPKWMIGRRGRHGCHVRIKAELVGLSPGRHGFHIHTYGDISAHDGTSTGGHFTNPFGDEIDHGYSSSKVRHWGDLNSVMARPNGKAKYNRSDNLLRLEYIVGRGITIHEDRDKGPMFQPSGSAGARVGMCVIGYANPEA